MDALVGLPSTSRFMTWQLSVLPQSASKVTAARLVRQLCGDYTSVRRDLVDPVQSMINYVRDWGSACVVIVGGRARRHALQLDTLCTCLECGLYACCEHIVFVDGLDLPIRAKIRDFTTFHD